MYRVANVNNLKVKLVIECFREYAKDGVIRGQRSENTMPYSYSGVNYVFDMNEDISQLIKRLDKLTGRTK